MKNVHLLQTEVYPAKLQLDRDYGTLTIFDEPCVSNGQDFVGANLYITSNEEIQIDEWCFEIYNRESTAVAPRFIDENNNTWWLRQINMSVSADDANCKKIILTTDVRLIKDGVQAIDDEFLDWFIKNQKREIPIITTTVNNESHYTTNIGFESWRKEPKQETLEEVALRQLFKNRSNCYADTGRFENDGSYSEGEVIQAMDEDCFINTIKEWQQERSYSEEEVELIKNRALAYGATDSFKQWFEQFKKK